VTDKSRRLPKLSADLWDFEPENYVQELSHGRVHVLVAANVMLDGHFRVSVTEQLGGQVHAGLVVDDRGYGPAEHVRVDAGDASPVHHPTELAADTGGG